MSKLPNTRGTWAVDGSTVGSNLRAVHDVPTELIVVAVRGKPELGDVDVRRVLPDLIEAFWTALGYPRVAVVVESAASRWDRCSIRTCQGSRCRCRRRSRGAGVV